MAIHLRTFEDDRGDVVEYAWFDTRTCYLNSFGDPDFDGVEPGGAYPCGEESDTPDFCAHCGAPVGNPLTGEGIAYLRELVADWHGAQWLREALAHEYAWAFDNDEED